MTSYFDEVVEALTIEDMNLLAVLDREKASKKTAAVSSSRIMEAGNLSESIFRKLSTRLSALRFVEVTATFKENALHLTPYGYSALLKLGLKPTESNGIKLSVQ